MDYVSKLCIGVLGFRQCKFGIKEKGASGESNSPLLVVRKMLMSCFVVLKSLPEAYTSHGFGKSKVESRVKRKRNVFNFAR
jgi:hypothetical protein